MILLNFSSYYEECLFTMWHTAWCYPSLVSCCSGTVFNCSFGSVSTQTPSGVTVPLVEFSVSEVVKQLSNKYTCVGNYPVTRLNKWAPATDHLRPSPPPGIQFSQSPWACSFVTANSVEEPAAWNRDENRLKELKPGTIRVKTIYFEVWIWALQMICNLGYVIRYTFTWMLNP